MILSLVALIAVQLLSIVANLVCWEISESCFGPEYSYKGRVCERLDRLLELVFTLQAGGNFLFFIFLNPDFASAFLGRLKPEAEAATRWAVLRHEAAGMQA